MGLPWRSTFLWGWAVWITAVGGGQLAAKVSEAELAAAEYSGVSLPQERIDIRGMRQAQQRLARGEYAQAIRFLQGILAREEDSFLPADVSSQLRGLKERSWNLLAELPPAGREAYEATFGPVARRLLRQAVTSGDVDALRALVVQYFHTRAGIEAAVLLARQEADLGRHLAASLLYEKLLAAVPASTRFEPQLSFQAALSCLAVGNRQRAGQLLQNLRQRGPQRMQVAGREVSWELSQPDWLQQLVTIAGQPLPSASGVAQQWVTPGGNPQRAAQPQGGLPHLRQDWQVRLLLHPALEDAHRQVLANRRQEEQVAIPAAAPLAVGNQLITRSAHKLLAIDFITGKRIWQVQAQKVPAVELLLEGGHDELEEDSQDPTHGFSQRVWEDYLYNTISSDGERVFAIRDLQMPGAERREPWQAAVLRNATPKNSGAGTNRLCAYDLATQGKLVWEVDGAVGPGSWEGAFFLGAPLAVGQSLYGLVEVYGEKAVYLVALDRHTGALRWRQQLAHLELGILEDTSRRLQAIMPSYDAGILVCPTGAGVVVGIDLAKRALAWAYRYPTRSRQAMLSLQQRNLRAGIPWNQNQWLDGVVTLAQGHVLLTPPESHELHCLDLASGKLLWKQPRGSGLQLAGVAEDHVLVLEESGVRAVNLHDGQPCWSPAALSFPAQTYPTGRGFISDGTYYLPLSNAEIVALDIRQGKITDRAVSRAGDVLGNLICHQGTVISQTGQCLERYGQVEILRQQAEETLAKHPRDPRALRTLGEIDFQQGNLDRALQRLSQAYDLQPQDLLTRDVLRACLLEALSEDFATYREHLPLLADVQGPSDHEQLTLLRLQVQGLIAQGDVLQAFGVCQQMAQRLPVSSASLELDRQHQVTWPRWIAARVAELWARANAGQRAQLARRLESQLQQFAAPEPLTFSRSMVAWKFAHRWP